MARRSPDAPSNDGQQHPVRRQAARHRVARQAGDDGRRLRRAFAQTQHVFAPCVSIPNAITMQWSRKTLPSMQTTRRSSSLSGRLRNDRSRLADSATNRRDTALLDVPRSVTSAGAGSNVPAYRRVDTPVATAASVRSSSGSAAAAHWKLGSGPRGRSQDAHLTERSYRFAHVCSVTRAFLST